MTKLVGVKIRTSWLVGVLHNTEIEQIIIGPNNNPTSASFVLFESPDHNGIDLGKVVARIERTYKHNDEFLCDIDMFPPNEQFYATLISSNGVSPTVVRNFVGDGSVMCYTIGKTEIQHSFNISSED